MLISFGWRIKSGHLLFRHLNSYFVPLSVVKWRHGAAARYHSHAIQGGYSWSCQVAETSDIPGMCQLHHATLELVNGAKVDREGGGEREEHRNSNPEERGKKKPTARSGVYWAWNERSASQPATILIGDPNCRDAVANQGEALTRV